jgi:alpha-D-ribose 1-methylphosphonate 5-triphosphate synthase subunit PhnL
MPDTANGDVVTAMILEAKRRKIAIVGIFHDAAMRGAVADRTDAVAPLQDAA